MGLGEAAERIGRDGHLGGGRRCRPGRPLSSEIPGDSGARGAAGVHGGERGADLMRGTIGVGAAAYLHTEAPVHAHVRRRRLIDVVQALSSRAACSARRSGSGASRRTRARGGRGAARGRRRTPCRSRNGRGRQQGDREHRDRDRRRRLRFPIPHDHDLRSSDPAPPVRPNTSSMSPANRRCQWGSARRTAASGESLGSRTVWMP